MALRKDKVAEALRAMKGICSSPDDPTSLPDALGQLADILGNVFDDIALPDLSPIDPGEFSFPEDAPFDFPLGGGGIPALDPLGGFEGSPPGGGDGFGEDGGEGGEGGGEGGGICDEAYTKHVTLLGKTVGEMPAAKDGIPGIGDVELQIVVPENQLKLSKCNQKCHDDFAEQIKTIDGLIKVSKAAAGAGLFEEFFNNQIEDLIRQKFDREKDFRVCLEKCRKEDNKNDVGDEIVAGARVEDTREVHSAKNISCEVIEKDTQVLISGTISYIEEYDPEKDDVFERPSLCEPDDLYVIVEACGCD